MKIQHGRILGIALVVVLLGVITFALLNAGADGDGGPMRVTPIGTAPAPTSTPCPASEPASEPTSGPAAVGMRPVSYTVPRGTPPECPMIELADPTGAPADGDPPTDPLPPIEPVPPIEPGDPGGAKPFNLTSSAFDDNGDIDAKFTCSDDGSAGNDVSPPLAWGAGSHDAKSYAITFIDVDNDGKHWVIFDLPASTVTLPEGLGKGFEVPGQSPAKQKAMSSGDKSLQYFGPCPGGSSHDYNFTLYALDVETLPDVRSSSSVAEIEAAIRDHDIASTDLSGSSDASA